MDAEVDRKLQPEKKVETARRRRLRAATLAADRAEYRRTTMGRRVEQAMILSKELGELAARGLKRTDS